MELRFPFRAVRAMTLGLAITTMGQRAFADDETPAGTMKTTQASTGKTTYSVFVKAFVGTL